VVRREMDRTLPMLAVISKKQLLCFALFARTSRLRGKVFVVLLETAPKIFTAKTRSFRDKSSFVAHCPRDTCSRHRGDASRVQRSWTGAPVTSATIASIALHARGCFWTTARNGQQ
jgi:hypothetical protein